MSYENTAQGSERCPHNNQDFWNKYSDDFGHTVADKKEFKVCPFCPSPNGRVN